MYGGLRTRSTYEDERPAVWKSGVRARMRWEYALGSFVHVSPRAISAQFTFFGGDLKKVFEETHLS